MPTPDTAPTPVIFRVLEGEVIALFPTVPGTRDPYTCESYMHVGQHGSAGAALSYTARLATPEEYAPLKRELEQLGYVLAVHGRMTHHHFAARKAALAR